MAHPSAAAYVSADGKVSFDRYGRKLDSVGNVVAGDRQRAGDAGGKPIERKQEQQQPAAQNPAARYTFPANATGQPVARSAWDNSPIPPAQGAASAAGVSGAGRGNNPNVLAPGGIDPATGRPYPTALNGDLQVSSGGTGSRWRQPWMGQQAPSVAPPRPSGGNIPFQIDGLNVPSPSMQTGGLNVMPPQGNGFMYDPYSGSNAGGSSLPMMTPNVDRTGPQNFGRNLDVSAYMPGGAQYKSWR